jgi:predicted O-linked N-acetylglucosamine transferase (SPINDLY family)
MQQRLIEDAKEFINIEKKSVQDMKNSIIEKDIDLLIEMCGHTSNGSDLLNVLRHKPARVIAQYFAFPNTYGLPEIDYKIGDDIVFPFGLDRYYNEKFCKVKNGFHTYNPIMPIKVNKKEHEGIVFGCTNNPKKYRPDWIKCVSQILKQVENSKLVLRYFGLEDPSIQEFYWKEFEKHGIERKRIDMDIGASLLKYFESYSNMDICLDPFPYNGGTINIEILYAGLPYVTLLGASYVSRVGASILTQVGHPELIAKTQEQYVNMAVGLAKDSERLKKYKETLREDFDKSTLGDNKAFTQNFEDSVMWMLRDSEKIPTEFKFPEVEAVESIPKLVISEKF